MSSSEEYELTDYLLGDNRKIMEDRIVSILADSPVLKSHKLSWLTHINQSDVERVVIRYLDGVNISGQDTCRMKKRNITSDLVKEIGYSSKEVLIEFFKLRRTLYENLFEDLGDDFKFQDNPDEEIPRAIESYIASNPKRSIDGLFNSIFRKKSNKWDDVTAIYTAVDRGGDQEDIYPSLIYSEIKKMRKNKRFDNFVSLFKKAVLNSSTGYSGTPFDPATAISSAERIALYLYLTQEHQNLMYTDESFIRLALQSQPVNKYLEEVMCGDSQMEGELDDINPSTNNIIKLLIKEEMILTPENVIRLFSDPHNVKLSTKILEYKGLPAFLVLDKYRSLYAEKKRKPSLKKILKEMNFKVGKETEITIDSIGSKKFRASTLERLMDLRPFVCTNDVLIAMLRSDMKDLQVHWPSHTHWPSLFEEGIKKKGREILDKIPYKIPDNLFTTDDRNVMETLSDIGLIHRTKHEITLLDGREWKHHFVLLKEKEINAFVNDPYRLLKKELEKEDTEKLIEEIFEYGPDLPMDELDRELIIKLEKAGLLFVEGDLTKEDQEDFSREALGDMEDKEAEEVSFEAYYGSACCIYLKPKILLCNPPFIRKIFRDVKGNLLDYLEEHNFKFTKKELGDMGIGGLFDLKKAIEVPITSLDSQDFLVVPPTADYKSLKERMKQVRTYKKLITPIFQYPAEIRTMRGKLGTYIFGDSGDIDMAKHLKKFENTVSKAQTNELAYWNSCVVHMIEQFDYVGGLGNKGKFAKIFKNDSVSSRLNTLCSRSERYFDYLEEEAGRVIELYNRALSLGDKIISGEV